MTELTAQTLPARRDHLPTPGYDRSALRVGIVHLGVGGFHRAHQAMYLDRLMNQGLALDWAICGVGVLPTDSRMRAALQAQDGLYTLVRKSADGTYDARVIGSIVEYLLAPDDPERVIERMTDPLVRIVSLTVTEGGYNINAVTGEFAATAADVVHDLAPGAVPRTTFGLITEALVRRRERSLAPFTVMSCDNIQGNGEVARSSFAAFATLRNAELGDWVRSQVCFPNSMVDRITPVTTDADRDQVAARFGVEDRWPVVCEPFTQWVLQDAFGNGRPPVLDPEAGCDLIPVGVRGNRRDAVDHGVGVADLAAHPVAELGVAQRGKGSEAPACHLAVALDVVAGHHRERSQAPLPATDQSLGDQAERRSRHRPRRQVVHDVRGSGGELAGDGVDVVAAFGDGQRDDPDQRIGHPLDHPLRIIGRQQVLDD